MNPAMRRSIRWLAVLLWTAAIFSFSSIPGSQIPGNYSVLGHLSEYAILGALLYFALRFDLDRSRALSLAIILASAYGITDEFHQHFVVMRTPDPADWALDTLGALAGAAIAMFVGGYVGLRAEHSATRVATQ